MNKIRFFKFFVERKHIWNKIQFQWESTPRISIFWQNYPKAVSNAWLNLTEWKTLITNKYFIHIRTKIFPWFLPPKSWGQRSKDWGCSESQDIWNFYWPIIHASMMGAGSVIYQSHTRRLSQKSLWSKHPLQSKMKYNPFLLLFPITTVS